MLVFTIAAAALGVMMGYIFAWAMFGSGMPTSGQVAAFIGLIFSGTVLSIVEQFNSPYKLAAYVIGVAIGFALYIISLHLNKEKVLFAIRVGAISRPPLNPWRLDKPCSMRGCQHWHIPNTDNLPDTETNS